MNAGAKKKCAVTVHIWFVCHAPLSKEKWKKSTNPSQLSGVVYFTPRSIKSDILSNELFKTGQITPLSSFEGWFFLFLFNLFPPNL